MDQNQYFDQSPGLLIKLTRLNVPCNEGGYIKFNQSNTMCGKLEEISDYQRTMYFKSFENTTLTTYNYPKFTIVYKLVDTCYDVKLLEPNSSFSIKPTQVTLECYFKIHLPFGYQISLNLYLNSDRSSSDTNRNSNSSTPTGDVENIVLNAIKKSKTSNKNINNNLINTNEIDYNRNADTNGAQNCLGIIIEIIASNNERWVHCVNSSSIKKLYKLTTSDNVLDVRVRRQSPNKISPNSVQESKSNTNSVVPTIHLEYTAIAIESIVSQCAFGWILVGQFCVSTINELLTWQHAENYCNREGGHLASIRSENEQTLVNKLLLNR